jgi:integrase/recombinase XerD
MLIDHLKTSITRDRLYAGLAGPYIDEFADWLHGQGFKPVVIKLKLTSLAGWTDWVRDKRLSPHDPVAAMEACKTHLEKNGRVLNSRGPNDNSIVAASTYIRFLRAKGVIEKVPAKPLPSEIWPILGEFRSWSRQHRGTKETTLDLYDTTLRDFIKVLGDVPRTYTAKAIRDFVLNRAKPHSIYRAQAITVAVRAFLRFLAATGRCSVNLVYAVPSYPSHQLVSVPRYLEPADVQRVINACTAEDANGLRDRAVILLLTRFGLRAGDVAALSFSDIDWKNGRIAVSGKNRKPEWLPLPQDVGDAILRYIREGRPPLKINQIFTKVDAPMGPLNRASVTHIARSALRRAKIKAPVNGAHVFRHSAATAMLREGVTLAGVGAVLRHGSPDTTALYAKVDFGLLASITQEWPAVVSC